MRMSQRLGVLTLILLIVAAAVVWRLWPEPKPQLQLEQVTFNQLPAWSKATLKKSFLAFTTSCQAFLKQPSTKPVGSQVIPLTAGDWQPLCQEAFAVNLQSATAVKAFFEQQFAVVRFSKEQPVKGLFTGYYLPLLHGSLTRTAKYNVPIYGIPRDLIKVDLGLFDEKLKHQRVIGRVKNNRLVPYPTREKINRGAVSKQSKVLVWVDSRLDRFFLEIQGSGMVELDDGRRLTLGYGSQNGGDYTSLAGLLIKDGLMTADSASMQTIREYFSQHPEKMDHYLHRNSSFVFFKRLPTKAVYGSQGVALTEGYSLAVDRHFVPLGAPVWLTTTYPGPKGLRSQPLNRLMVAQDTGGAIKGAVRGDVFWGAGEAAYAVAGRMKDVGYYYLLLPKSAIAGQSDLNS